MKLNTLPLPSPPLPKKKLNATAAQSANATAAKPANATAAKPVNNCKEKHERPSMNPSKNNFFKKLKKPAAILAIFSLLTISCSQSKAEGPQLIKSSLNQNVESIEEFLLYATFDLLNENHYLQRPLNKQHFQQIFDTYMYFWDKERLFFTSGQLQNIFEENLPNQTLKPLLNLTKSTFPILQKNSKKYFDYAEKILAKPLNFTVAESYETNPQKINFLENQQQLKDRWRKQLKYRVLRLLLQDIAADNSIIEAEEKKDAGANSEPETTTSANFAEAEKKARETVMLNIKKLFANNYNTLTEKDLQDSYLKAVTFSYDKHSEYYPPLDKENFDIQMGGELEGIGAEISKSEDGLIEIRGIIPGGPTYRQKEIEVGDKIVSVGQAANTMIDVEPISLNDALVKIRGKKGTTVHLKILKKDGTLKTIRIVRDRVVLEGTYAKSAVLESNGSKHGYLYLPKFYRDFNNKAKRTTTGDVYNELLKLNASNVDGLIIDLRNNSGGALEDAILVSGLFIENGPILSIKGKGNKKNSLYDRNPEVVFTKPIVVLVSYLSASASEILAAALQDYGRAIIVGTDKSYGKGTVQTIESIAKYYGITGANAEKMGYLKYTFQKFYRITGFSTQVQGVLSDITLPFLMQELSEDDPNMPYVNIIKSDTTNPVPHSLWNKFQYPITELKRNSEERVQKNTQFKNISSRHNLIKEFQKKTLQPLNFEKAIAERKNYLKNIAKHPVNLNKKLTFNVQEKNYSQQEQQAAGYKEKKEIFDTWLREINKDIYIEEGLNILKDISPQSGQNRQSRQSAGA